jgi:hypothetical protein
MEKSLEKNNSIHKNNCFLLDLILNCNSGRKLNISSRSGRRGRGGGGGGGGG